MIDRKALLTDLKKQVQALEQDLSRQVKALSEINARLRAEYDQARKIGRTAATWNSWLDERVTQVAVAWVLGTVFVRFCEDNRLIPEPYLAAPEADRNDLARARYEAYVEEDEDPTYRGWLERAFAELGEGQAGMLLFDRAHNPLFQIPISHDAAGALINFWKTRNEDGTLVHDFTDPLNDDGTEGWDTRFLGDLYQDLSESARKKYALLQTPEFVEEFILDRTMDPAIREFGFEELKMIDPTCGSGHFILGAFRRLVRLWNERQPGRDRYERVRAALDSVHGVDINPFAIAVARFRLLVAAMAAANIRTLAEAAKYEWPLHLAIGDSLIKARQLELSLTSEQTGDPLAEFSYATEDVHEHPRILEPGRYHVVVGNPPYITPKDENINQVYRDLYDACSGKYALTVPFAQRFFGLAKKGTASTGCGYGLVGQITSNAFMKREYGRKLIEDFYGERVELTEVIDSSGVYIPGHGTPTVILIGKSRSGPERSPYIRTVRSRQGEPSVPKKAEDGLVWNAIVRQVDTPGSISPWVSVDDLERDRCFRRQPWILADGGLEMIEIIEEASSRPLGRIAKDIGITSVTGEDDLYLLPPGSAERRYRFESSRPVVTGDMVRDYRITGSFDSAWVYDDDYAVRPLEEIPHVFRYLAPYRPMISKRKRFGVPMITRGYAWYEWQELYNTKLKTQLRIAFAEVATHNHFTLDESRPIFNRTAPVIVLDEDVDRSFYLQLLGILNSSTACFWLKMMCHNKGSTVDARGARQSTLPFEDFYQFNSSNIARFPIPENMPTTLPQRIASLVAKDAPTATGKFSAPVDATRMRMERAAWRSIRGKMIALQEELDWQVYSIYGLHPEDLRAPEEDVPELALGERAFEIVLARRIAKGEASDEWFKRHGSTPITEIPEHWPESYKRVVQKRIEAIETSRAIGMIERPEYKRRWATEGWDALQEKALRSWLLDRIEKREHWFDANDMPVLVTLSRLTDMLAEDDDFVSVAKLYRPREELAKVVADLMADEHVPFLASLRYKPSGLKKWADWEHVWDLQRQEDAAPDEITKRKIRDSIPTPPKYTSADFIKQSYWRARGKLDVPKERFISYPTALGVQPQLFGWAGWDHREQAQALATYFTNQALTREEIAPFLAGLLELQPWLKQWHDDFHPLYSGSPAAFFEGYRQQIQGEHGLTDDDLRNWRPEPVTRGRKAAKKK